MVGEVTAFFYETEVDSGHGIFYQYRPAPTTVL